MVEVEEFARHRSLLAVVLSGLEPALSAAQGVTPRDLDRMSRKVLAEIHPDGQADDSSERILRIPHTAERSQGVKQPALEGPQDPAPQTLTVGVIAMLHVSKSPESESSVPVVDLQLALVWLPLDGLGQTLLDVGDRLPGLAFPLRVRRIRCKKLLPNDSPDWWGKVSIKNGKSGFRAQTNSMRR